MWTPEIGPIGGSHKAGTSAAASRCCQWKFAVNEVYLTAGWRAALEALTVALGDGAPPVVNQALDAIQPVVEALYRCIHALHKTHSRHE